MQPHQADRFRATSTPKSIYINPTFLPQDTLRPALVIAAVCLLLPPVGLFILWRSRRMTMHIRTILSVTGFISMTLIFFLLLRPKELPSAIQPMPAMPSVAGYGSASQTVSIPFGNDTMNVPAQPGIAAPAPVGGDFNNNPIITSPTVSTPAGLTPESIVFAVTNNASSYHIFDICDFQENHRALTLQNALDEGLAPCEKCIGTTE